MSEKIVSAAVRIGVLVFSREAPARHHHVLHQMSATMDMPQDKTWEQGFLTSHGRFVDRFDACHIARDAGQLDIVRPKTGSSRELFSEDLW